MQEDFVTKLEAKDCCAYFESSLYPPKFQLEDFEFSDISVLWNIEMNCKQYGIVGHTTSIKEISGTITTRYFDEEPADNEDPKELVAELSYFINDKYNSCVKYKSERHEIDLLLEVDLTFNGNGCLVPSEIEIDFKNKNIVLR